MRRIRIAIACAAATAAVLAGCSDPNSPDPTNSSTQANTSEATTTDATTPTTTPSGDTGSPIDGAPEFPATADPQTSEPSGTPDLVLTNVTVTDEDGFTRLLLEFSGTGTPGWNVGYGASAEQQGNGDPVQLDGDALMTIDVTGTTQPASQEEYYSGPKTFDPEDGDIDGVFVDGPFEGITRVIIGVDGPATGAPYRVFTAGDPMRVVVDVLDTED